jgi:hypothetical protein
MFQDEGWVELCSATTEYEAHLIIGLLQSNGVTAQLKSYKVSQFPVDIGHIGEIKIMVLEEDMDIAKEILENSDKSIKNGQKVENT